MGDPKNTEVGRFSLSARLGLSTFFGVFLPLLIDDSIQTGKGERDEHRRLKPLPAEGAHMHARARKITFFFYLKERF